MRPSDWSALDLGSDPVPGEPGIVLSGGRDYLAVADAIKDSERKLRTLDLGSAVVSQSIDALIETSGKVADNIGKAEARYRATGDALSRYAPALEAAQRESMEALSLAQSARSAADSASNDKQHYLRLAADEHDPQRALTYTNLAEDLDSDAAGAHAHLANAQGRAHEAMAARDRAAQAAIDDIHAITKHDGLKDSWWDDWGKDLLSVITDVAGWVSSIAGVLALLVCWIPVIGQALAAVFLLVAGIAAVVNAIGNIVLAATGDRSWTEAIISIAGAVLAVVGMGAAARVVGNVASAARINAKAGVEIAAGQAEKLTVRQAIRLKPSELSDSEGLWAKPVSDLKPGDSVYRLHGNGALPEGASYSTLSPSQMRNPRSSLGLPDVNSGENLIVARVDSVDNVVVTRHALPLNGQPGGAPEYIIPGAFGPSKGITVLSDTPLRVR
ncbi:hypothetical protein [Lacisediminihabitans sp. H27-G8]|uniref:hypothetical protein n=1 Tax=Lacisediminihabitans sp. H27-G8 TaxID=3111909 RepID=UPI0038FD370F